MKLYTLGAVGIVLLMFICVLFGMQQANSGIHKMKGYEDQGFQSAVSIKNEDGNMEASVLGQNITSHDLDQKNSN